MREVRGAGPGGLIHTWIASPAGAGRTAAPDHRRHPRRPARRLGAGSLIEVVLLCARGYRVVLPNIRGSTSYGRDWIRPHLGNWGGPDAEDVHAALDHAIALGLADPDRLGVLGLSYGGFMVNWLVGTTDRFKAAVSVAGSRTRSRPGRTATPGSTSTAGRCWEPLDPEGVEKLWRQSPLANVANVHAAADPPGRGGPALHAEDNVQLFTALRVLGRTVEYVLYPEEPHVYFTAGRPDRRIDHMTRMLDWFDRHVRGLEAGPATRAGPGRSARASRARRTTRRRGRHGSDVHVERRLGRDRGAVGEDAMRRPSRSSRYSQAFLEAAGAGRALPGGHVEGLADVELLRAVREDRGRGFMGADAGPRRRSRRSPRSAARSSRCRPRRRRRAGRIAAARPRPGARRAAAPAAMAVAAVVDRQLAGTRRRPDHRPVRARKAEVDPVAGREIGTRPRGAARGPRRRGPAPARAGSAWESRCVRLRIPSLTCSIEPSGRTQPAARRGARRAASRRRARVATGTPRTLRGSRSGACVRGTGAGFEAQVLGRPFGGWPAPPAQRAAAIPAVGPWSKVSRRGLWWRLLETPASPAR